MNHHNVIELVMAAQWDPHARLNEQLAKNDVLESAYRHRLQAPAKRQCLGSRRRCYQQNEQQSCGGGDGNGSGSRAAEPLIDVVHEAEPLREHERREFHARQQAIASMEAKAAEGPNICRRSSFDSATDSESDIESASGRESYNDEADVEDEDETDVEYEVDYSEEDEEEEVEEEEEQDLHIVSEEEIDVGAEVEVEMVMHDDLKYTLSETLTAYEAEQAAKFAATEEEYELWVRGLCAPIRR